MEPGQQLIIGITEFESKKEADMVAESLRAMANDPDETKKTITSVFCPLIKAHCRMDCASWEKAVVYTNENNKFVIIGHRCVSPMIKTRHVPRTGIKR